MWPWRVLSSFPGGECVSLFWEVLNFLCPSAPVWVQALDPVCFTLSKCTVSIVPPWGRWKAPQPPITPGRTSISKFQQEIHVFIGTIDSRESNFMSRKFILSLSAYVSSDTPWNSFPLWPSISVNLTRVIGLSCSTPKAQRQDYISLEESPVVVLETTTGQGIPSQGNRASDPLLCATPSCYLIPTLTPREALWPHFTDINSESPIYADWSNRNWYSLLPPTPHEEAHPPSHQ